ncbi:MAG: threonine synthase [Prevotella sp.]|nr:threonine synthase [Prevotella sp.]
MKYYSTNKQAPVATLEKAVVKGLAEDRGLYMPETIGKLPKTFFENIEKLSFQEIAYAVAETFFGKDVEPEALKKIVYDTLAFDCPIVEVEENIYSLELFHGPTLAFKDVGARFMARLLQYFIRKGSKCPTLLKTPKGLTPPSTVNVLVATSGDTGSAVANGFLGVEGIHVYVLYPKGKVSLIQESQFTTLGKNITAIEVDGVFDDCQALVKNAFMDKELNDRMRLTSANSINVARFLPQAFYYFNAYARLKEKLQSKNTADSTAEKQHAVAANDRQTDLDLVVCVPSGNFGNICAALFGHAMGLPVKRFIAANNANDIFYKYLQTGIYEPKPTKQTLANAMDVGNPSNFARITDLYSREDIKAQIAKRAVSASGKEQQDAKDTYQTITSLISGATYSDEQIKETMRECHQATGYILDPHGACGYRALKDGLQSGEIGIFCETAHPAKFKEKVDAIDDIDVEIPKRLAAFMKGTKQSISMSKEFKEFKEFLLKQATQESQAASH